MRTSSRGHDWLLGAAAGAAAVFFLDPQLGGRRRALLVQQLDHVTRKLEQGFDAATHDLRNRAIGLASELKAYRSGEQPDDETLTRRVRARLGHYSSHPHAVRVLTRDGCVELKGPILAAEHRSVISAVRRVRGVNAVDDDLDVHDSAEGVPALQGAGKRRRGMLGGRTSAPASRLALSSLGAALGLAGLRAERSSRYALGAMSLFLLARSTGRSLEVTDWIASLARWAERKSLSRPAAKPEPASFVLAEEPLN